MISKASYLDYIVYFIISFKNRWIFQQGHSGYEMWGLYQMTNGQWHYQQYPWFPYLPRKNKPNYLSYIGLIIHRRNDLNGNLEILPFVLDVSGDRLI